MPTYDADMGSARRQREIERETERYRSTLSSVSADKLISMYMPYILKWVRFLTTLAHTTEGPFRLFLRDPHFRRVPGDLQSKHKLVVDSLRAYDKDDIFSDVCVAFLEACLKSDNLVYGLPHFLAKRVYDAIKDPLVFAGRCHNLADLESDPHEGQAVPVRSTVGSGARTDTLDRFFHQIKDCKTQMIPVGHGEDDTVLSFMEDLVTVVQRDDGLVGISLSRDWVDGQTVGMGHVPEFSELTREDREVILRFYLIKQRYEHIGLDMGITRRRARYLLSRARTRLREALRRTRPEEYS